MDQTFHKKNPHSLLLSFNLFINNIYWQSDSNIILFYDYIMVCSYNIQYTFICILTLYNIILCYMIASGSWINFNQQCIQFHSVQTRWWHCNLHRIRDLSTSAVNPVIGILLGHVLANGFSTTSPHLTIITPSLSSRFTRVLPIFTALFENRKH